LKGLSPLARYYREVKEKPRWIRLAEHMNALMVRDMRTLEPDYFSILVARYSSLAYRHTHVPNLLFLAITLEGLLQTIAARVMFQGVPTDAGAVIPIKRFEIDGYKSFAATWALLLWSRDEVLVPYAGEGFVKAKINDYNNAKTLFIVDSVDDVIEFTDPRIMERALVYRGDLYSIYYDYTRLGVKPPSSIAIGNSYIFDHQKGPMKLQKTTVYVIKRPLTFIFASVYSVVWRLVDFAWRNEFPVSRGDVSVKELLKVLPSIGFKKEAVLEEADEYLCDICGALGPESFLFAEVDGGKGFIALRPMPVELWKPDEITWSFSFNVRPTPPYHYGIFGPRKTPRTLHIIPGSIVARLPKLKYEVG